MMTLKFSRNAKVTRALTGRRAVGIAAHNDFEIVVGTPKWHVLQQADVQYVLQLMMALKIFLGGDGFIRAGKETRSPKGQGTIRAGQDFYIVSSFN